MMSGILRQPMAILGAIGLLSLAEDLLQWQEQVQTWIDAWQAFSQPVVSFAFGWLVNLLPFDPPSWWTEYAAMGIIVSASYGRFIYEIEVGQFQRSTYNNILDTEIKWYIPERKSLLFYTLHSLMRIPYSVIFWPIVVVKVFRMWSEANGMYRMTRGFDHPVRFFYESFVWAAVFIAINYAWLASG